MRARYAWSMVFLAGVALADTAPVGSALGPTVEKGIEWIVKAQHPDGGWGAGSHARQNIKDPHQVQTDPATTAFTTLSLLRSGRGMSDEVVRKAVAYLVKAVREGPKEGPKVTALEGTQIQTKLGPLVDTAMTAQCLARVLRLLPEGDPLRGDVDAALETCIGKLQAGQAANGSWGGGGWAPVLQSSLATSALEVSKAAGKKVDEAALEKAREHQQGNFDAATGRAAAKDGAGVELYGMAGAQRATAGEAKAARDVIDQAKAEGVLPPAAPVTAENLRAAGLDEAQATRLAAANDKAQAQAERMNDEQLLRGFGNNGGEEFLSHALTAESLVIAASAEWATWREKMEKRFAAIQSNDGSWSGHHCITSPVFCTAAVIQALTADRDAELLRQIAKDVKGEVKKDEAKGEPKDTGSR